MFFFSIPPTPGHAMPVSYCESLGERAKEPGIFHVSKEPIKESETISQGL